MARLLNRRGSPLALRAASLLAEVSYRFRGHRHLPATPEFRNSGGADVPRRYGEWYRNETRSIRAHVLQRASDFVLREQSAEWLATHSGLLGGLPIELARESETLLIACLERLAELDVPPGGVAA